MPPDVPTTLMSMHARSAGDGEEAEVSHVQHNRTEATVVQQRGLESLPGLCNLPSGWPRPAGPAPLAAHGPALQATGP